MIKINKKAIDRPDILYSRGAKKGIDKLEEATNDLKQFYLTHRINIENGKKKFNFNSDLYAHDKIKEALKKIQFNKCCFCEARVDHIAYGDIEHFRPKAAYIQKDGDVLVFPGYFWLAYDWENLFFSCQLCNQRHKKNLFPMMDENSRFTKCMDDINQEDNLFLDPCKDDPSKHIVFIDEIPREVPGSKRGKETIKSLGLDRLELNEDRKTNLNKFIDMLNIIKMYPNIPEMKEHHDNAKAYIKSKIFDLMKPHSEYSSMFICLYEQQIKSIL